MPDDSKSAAAFGELTLATFVDRLASPEPVPGGGSASAVAASLAAALVAMVASLSQNRAKYAAHAALHLRAAAAGQRLASRLLELADSDAQAYAGFASALKLPRETSPERAVRDAALSKTAREAAEVPLAIIHACLEVVATAESLAGRSNANAASDLNVAAMLGGAAARGAAENVLVNLPSVRDDAFEADATDRVMVLLDSIEELASRAHEIVRSGSTRDPLPE